MTDDRQSQKIETREQSEKPQEKKATYIKVRPGDSLIKIAKKHKTTYPRLFDANIRIEHPDVIYPDQKLRIPHKDEELKKRPLPKDAAVQRTGTPTRDTQHSSDSTYRPQVSQQIAVSSSSGGVWDRLAGCESGGNWSINTGNGYYGGLQFSLSSWRGVGGSGYPHQASKSEQIHRAKLLQARQGWGAWPACTAKLGIR